MLKDICDLIMKLYLYADMTKKIHYSTNSNHCHELCDTVRDHILDFVDDLAEQSFGYYGKPSFSQMSLKQNIQETDDLKKLCSFVTDLVSSFEKSIQSESKLSNLVSLIDDFKGDLAQDSFLSTFDKVSNYKNNK